MAGRRLCPSVHPRREVPCILPPDHPSSCTDGTHRWTLPQGVTEPVEVTEEMVVAITDTATGMTYERAYDMRVLSTPEMLADLFDLADRPDSFTVSFAIRDAVPA